MSSEQPEHPAASLLMPITKLGWQATDSGPQTLRIIFHRPERIRHLHLEFDEYELNRTQEFLLRRSSDGGRSYQEILRQQYNFSPPHTTAEIEDYSVELEHVTNLELSITPDISGGPARASIRQLRIA